MAGRLAWTIGHLDPKLRGRSPVFVGLWFQSLPGRTKEISVVTSLQPQTALLSFLAGFPSVLFPIKDPVFSSNHQVLISNLPPSCCTNTHSWSHWKQRIAHASIHMHRCFRYFCIHLIINSFKKAFPQVQAFTTVLSAPLTELIAPLTDLHTDLNDLLVPGQKASQHVY